MAYISAEDVKAIRTELKQAFPNWKFSVRKGSGSLSVDVSILQGDVDFSENLQNGYTQVNQYWIDSHWANLEARAALNRINEIMHNAPGRAGGKVFFDESDAMTDYFHTAFYTHLSIGAWNKNYALVK
jgi:Large polyvalent protein associated domain 29